LAPKSFLCEARQNQKCYANPTLYLYEEKRNGMRDDEDHAMTTTALALV